MADIVTIEALGHLGDGIVREGGQPLYVPFTLPGERVRIERHGSSRARAVEIVAPSAQRVAAPCRHFGMCGGCALQMLPLPATHELKRGFVAEALRQQGLPADVDPTIAIPAANRRRAVLTAVRTGGRTLLGYHERMSNRVVDIAECPVLLPRLAAGLPAVRALLASCLPPARPARVTILATKAGLDVDVAGGRSPTPRQIERLAAGAAAAGIARLGFAGETLVQLGEPAIEISGVRVVPPPAAFLQAALDAEAAMAGIVTEHLGGAARVADLFAGMGAFALALARGSAVHAVDSNRPALAALATAIRNSTGLKPVTTESRDLFASPLSAQELSAFGAVVFDPPYAGAGAQAAELAQSRVPRIAAVSCNPGSFARDARTLVDGGYELCKVVPVDQFVYSAHVEVVGLFARR